MLSSSHGSLFSSVGWRMTNCIDGPASESLWRSCSSSDPALREREEGDRASSTPSNKLAHASQPCVSAGFREEDAASPRTHPLARSATVSGDKVACRRSYSLAAIWSSETSSASSSPSFHSVSAVSPRRRFSGSGRARRPRATWRSRARG